MNQGKYVFAQLVEFLDNDCFERIVRKYDGNKGIRGFSCWNQLLMMLFGQLSHRDSLRDLMTIIEAHESKAYHLGFGRCVNLSTISRANASRDYRIFEEFAMYIITYCAIIAYCLVAIVSKELMIERHIYTILQIVGFSLHDKTPLKQLLTTTDYKNIKEPDCNLLLFN